MLRVPRLRRAWWVLLTAVLMLAASGCEKSEKPRPDPDEGYLPDTSPANVLANLRQAYVERDLPHYERLFADSFVFTFNPLDVENPQNPTPVQWGRTDELDSASNMFGSQSVDKIELSFVTSPPVPGEGSLAGTSRVEMTDVNLQLDTRAGDGSPVKQIVTSGHERFYLEEFPAPSGGGTVWRIVRWEDLGFGTKDKSQNSTWGGIKSAYR